MFAQFKAYFFIFILFLLSSCSQKPDTLQGYIEGRYTYISSAAGGNLFTLDVSRGQQVTKNQLLFTLDPEPQKSIVEAAKATVEQLQAEVAFSKIQWERQQKLFLSNATDKASLDQAETNYNSSFKHLNNVKALVIKENWAYQQKRLFAPVSGYIEDTYYRLGEYIAPYQPVLSLLAPENIKVLFFIPETELSTIQLGQKIYFTCDGCNDRTQATITYISSQAEYTPPIIYSHNTRYKLVYLVRADMTPDIAVHFHPGQPVDIHLHD